jgi:predicted metal-dependent HD superfamily phosphohydrolase
MTPEILHEWVLGVTPDAQLARAVSDELVARYTEPHRRWHGLNHLDMLNNIPTDFLKEEKDALVLAILFHDAVYNVAAKDNEEKSAVLFCTYYPDYRRKYVVTEAIESTKHGYGLGTVAHMMTKLDRAILYEKDFATLLAYESDIAAEYMTAYSREDYLKGRTEFLRRQANPKLHELADFLESEKGYVRNNPTGR